MRTVDASAASQDMSKCGHKACPTKLWRTRMFYLKAELNEDIYVKLPQCPLGTKQTQISCRDCWGPDDGSNVYKEWGNGLAGAYGGQGCQRVPCSKQDGNFWGTQNAPEQHSQNQCCPEGSSHESIYRRFLAPGSTPESPTWSPAKQTAICLSQTPGTFEAAKKIFPNACDHGDGCSDPYWQLRLINPTTSIAASLKLRLYKDVWAEMLPGGKEMTTNGHPLRGKLPLGVHLDESKCRAAGKSPREQEGISISAGSGGAGKAFSGRVCPTTAPGPTPPSLPPPPPPPPGGGSRRMSVVDESNAFSAGDPASFANLSPILPSSSSASILKHLPSSLRRGFRPPIGGGENRKMLAPFMSDAMLEHYKYFPAKTDLPWSEYLQRSQVIDSSRMYSPFHSVAMQKTASRGTESCQFYATLAAGDTPERVESVDGVSLECLLNANPGLDGELIGMDIKQLLDFATGSSPAVNETVSIITWNETDPSNPTKRYRKGRFTFENFRRLQAQNEMMKENVRYHNRPCKPSIPSTGYNETCPRVGTTQRQSMKSLMTKKLASNVINVLVYYSVTDLETGALYSFGDGSSQTDWTTNPTDIRVPGCSVWLYGALNSKGQQLCQTPTKLRENAPKCGFNSMDDVIKGMETTLGKMTKGEIKPDTASLMPYAMSDTWFNCSDLVTRSISSTTKDVTGEVANCPFEHPWKNMCLGETEDSYCAAQPNDKWCQNACEFFIQKHSPTHLPIRTPASHPCLIHQI